MGIACQAWAQQLPENFTPIIERVKNAPTINGTHRIELKNGGHVSYSTSENKIEFNYPRDSAGMYARIVTDTAEQIIVVSYNEWRYIVLPTGEATCYKRMGTPDIAYEPEVCYPYWIEDDAELILKLIEE